MTENVGKADQWHEELTAVQDSMLEGLGQLADYFGFSKVMGQLFGVLLLSPKPLSLDDMVERLGISKASVSTTMRSMENMGIVRQSWTRGQSARRKFYEAETDFWQIFTNILSSREMRDVERALNVMAKNQEQLSHSIAEMNEKDAELAQLYLDRIQQMQSLFQFAQVIITSILAQAENMDLSDVSGVNIH